MANHDSRKPTRRRALGWLGGIGATALTGIVALSPRRTNAYYQGPISDHFDGVRFFNPGGPGPKSLRQVLRWNFATSAEAWPAQYPAPSQDRPPARVAQGGLRVSSIGHASFLIQMHARNILIDPVYAERASPVSFAGPKRVNAPGIAFDDLPKIDHVLITHNHYDHMDIDTIARLSRRDRPTIITPLGNDSILRDAIGDLPVRSVDWGDSVEIGPDIAVHAVRTQHWSARGTRDRMHALWASFVITSSKHTLYAVGDSGFGDGSTFRSVGERFTSIDLALLPIGAYEPRWFMRDQHMNPQEAVEAMLLCKARAAAGHHWGTFKLTNEGIERPREHLADALRARSIDAERFVAVRPGHVITLA
jgi:L-ascorbate metabolism protein UlaG (beta-lactamase superfamily)